MDKPIDNYWKNRLDTLKEKLIENNFDAFVADDIEDAKNIVLNDILPGTQAKSVSWGGSVTFVETKLYSALKDAEDLDVLDTYDKSFTPEEAMERRRQSLLTDLYITGTNAITEDGELVNLDMIGNRVAAITFGPKNVIVLIGRNKLTVDTHSAMVRIKNYAAPVNTMRLDKQTPCASTSFCHDCKSPDRICNSWVITEKSFPKGRIKVVLINEDLGF